MRVYFSMSALVFVFCLPLSVSVSVAMPVSMSVSAAMSVSVSVVALVSVCFSVSVNVLVFARVLGNVACEAIYIVQVCLSWNWLSRSLGQAHQHHRPP